MDRLTLGETMPGQTDEILADALLLLRRAQVRIANGHMEALSLILPNEQSVEVALHTHYPHPTRIASDVSRYPKQRRHLYVVAKTSAHLERKAWEGTIDLITLFPSQVIINGTRFLKDDASLDGDRLPHRRQRGKPPWGRWAIERALLQMKHPTTQKELAHLIGISPQAVSQALADHPYVQRTDHGWYVERTDSNVDRWINEYPGPGGAALYWYSLAPIVEQGHNAASLAAELEVQSLLSGDVAADDYAPWRLPATAIIYLREAVDFSVIDFMPTTRANATLIAKIPEDPTVWALGRTLAENPQRTLADPMLTLWDVTHSTGSDTDDAAEHLKAALTNGQLLD